MHLLLVLVGETNNMSGITQLRTNEDESFGPKEFFNEQWKIYQKVSIASFGKGHSLLLDMRTAKRQPSLVFRMT